MRSKKLAIALIVSLIGALFLTMSVTLAAHNGGAPRVASLSGAAEVPGPGDPDGSGHASIILNHGQGTVCWVISFENIADPFAAHIHVGGAEEAGPVVVGLDPNEPGCVHDVDRDLIMAIIQNPENYYVNVHNAAFPPGAIRGQLSNRGQAK